MNKPYQALIFDMDGTLADTDLVITATYIELFDKYRPEYPITLKEMVYFSGPPLEETIRNYFPDHDQTLIINEYHRISRTYYKKYIRSFPGETETLFALKEAGYRLGIITGKKHQMTITSLKLMGIEPSIFEFIIGSDDVTAQKPNIEAMQKALKQLNLHVNDILYIGDNTVDYLFAKNAGVDSALVSWTLRALDPKLNPTYIFMSYQHLKESLL